MSRTSFKILLSALFLAFAVGTAAHAAKPVADPIEPVNRAVFSFNNVLDRFLIEPLAKGYRAVVPKVVRTGVQNFMRNLRTPVTVANDLLQGRIGDAGTATARFIINTTVGRVLLNDLLPKGMPFVNGLLKKKGLQQLVQKTYLDFGLERTVEMLDALKQLGFTYATRWE